MALGKAQRHDAGRDGAQNVAVSPAQHEVLHVELGVAPAEVVRWKLRHLTNISIDASPIPLDGRLQVPHHARDHSGTDGAGNVGS